MIACRKEPGPLSFPFVTVMVAACAGIAIVQKSPEQIRMWRLKNAGRELDFLPSQSPEKSGVMGELCRIVRYLGSGIVSERQM